MIRVFRVIALEGPGNPYALSAGIAEALITTATGLIIAIPALLFHHCFTAKTDSLINEMERQSRHIVKLVSERRQSDVG